MPDINLLKDTTEENEDKKRAKPKARPKFELSKVEEEKSAKGEEEVKRPKFWSSLKSFFVRQPKVRILEEKVVEERKPETERRLEAKKVPPPKPSKRKKVPPRVTEPVLSQVEEEGGPRFLGVNLLPEEVLAKFEPRKKIITLGIVILICIGAIILIYGGMAWYQSRIMSKTQEVAGQIEDVDKEIVTYEEVRKESLALKNKLDKIQNLLDQHVYWSEFLEALEKYTLEDVYYTSLAGDIGGKITLIAVGRNFESVAQQYVVFKQAQDFVENVVITSASLSTSLSTSGEGEEAKSGVNFTIDLTINPDIFYKKTSEKGS